MSITNPALADPDPDIDIESETAPLLRSVTTEDAISAEYGIAAQHARGLDSYGTAGPSPRNGTSTETSPLLPNGSVSTHPKPSLSLVFPPIAIGIFLAAMDNTIIVASYGKIGSDLHSLSKTSWIATAYLLTTTSFQPLYGKLSDIFGRKSALLFAYTIFGLGCLLCGMAGSMEGLIASRAFAGIGGGGMTTVASILISDLVPLRQRGTWQGILNIVFATGSAAGAPLGGLLADSIGWRWSFLFQVPVSLLAIISVSLALKLPPHPNASASAASFRAQVSRVDFLGAFALIPAVFTLLLGLDLGSNTTFTSNLPVLLLGASALFFLAFAYIETHVSSEPFAPAHIISERTIFSACIVNFTSFAAQLSVLFYLPLYFQAVQGLSASDAGLRLLPGIAGGVTGSLFGGILMQKSGKYYFLTIAAYVFQFSGITAIFFSTGLIPSFRSTPATLTGLTIMSIGNGIGVTSTLIAIIATAGRKDQAVATAASYLFRALGMVSGIGISSGILQTRLRKILRAELGDGDRAEWIIEGVRGSLDFLKKLRWGERRLVVAAYEGAVRGVWGFAGGMAFCAILATLWIREKQLEPAPGGEGEGTRAEGESAEGARR